MEQTLYLEILLLITAGLVISYLSAILGVGGGVFTVPVLYYIARNSDLFPANLAHMAVSGSLLMAFVLSLSATLANLKQKRVAVKEGSILSAGNVVGALLGSVVAESLDSAKLATLFALFVLAMGVHSAFRQIRKKIGTQRSETLPRQEQESSPLSVPLQRILFLPSGVGVGIISSLTGIGGGILMVPLFRRVSGFTIHRAVATSSFAIIFTALAGVIGYGGSVLFSEAARNMPSPSVGFLYLPYVIPLALGGIIGGYMGGRRGEKIRSDTIQALFAFLQIAVALKILDEVRYFEVIRTSILSLLRIIPP